MEALSTGPVQSEDKKASQPSPACLRVPLILRKVMEHFSNKELIRHSLVDKQWNYEARSLMKCRGKTCAILRGRTPPDLPDCQKLAVFASSVRQMNIVPFCGMAIRVDVENHEGKCEASSIERIDPSSVQVLLDRLPWKFVTVCLNDNWKLNMKCPAFLLAKKVLEDFCEVLEDIVLRVPRDHAEFLGQVLSGSTFPRLKNLRLFGSFSHPSEGEEKIFIKTMVARCPNLRQLNLDYVSVDLTENLLEGSSAVVLVIENYFDPFNNEICEELLGFLLLRRIILEYADGNFSMERFNRIVPAVLQASKSVMCSLIVKFVFAVSLMRYGIRLENVTLLAIPMENYLCLFDAPSGRRVNLSPFWRILKNFDFTHIFPKLTKVEILDYHRNSPWVIGQFIEQGNAIQREPSPDRAVNIKHLTLKQSEPDVSLLASMFPEIETLEIDNSYGLGRHYALIWEHWVGLKQIFVHLTSAWGLNVDGVFCGIFPEEVAELREKDEEYLKAVNIVPVKPSITCMKELRTFTYMHQGSDPFNAENDPTFIFSKVTGLIAFARVPNLAVTLGVKSGFENGWNHMRDYANIVVL